MTTYLQDTFVDANGTLLESHTMPVGGGWSKFSAGPSSWTISNNKLLVPFTTSPPGAVGGYSSNAGHSSGTAGGTVQLSSSVDAATTLVGRFSDPSNLWFLQLANDGSIVFAKFVAGVETDIGVYDWVPDATNHLLSMVFNGDSISAFLDGLLLGLTTDSFNDTATRFGVTGFGSLNVLNDPTFILSFQVTNSITPLQPLAVRPLRSLQSKTTQRQRG